MASENWGGYRRPNNPAPVSGPGALSQRTDGGPASSQPVRDMPDAKYGENAAFRDAQQSAPMSSGLPDISGLTGMGAPSERPGEPISAGMPTGPGAGSTVAPDQGQGGLTPEQAERLRSYLPVLVVLASQDDADPATKRYVRALRGELG